MFQEKMLIPTLREAPNDAEVISHKLLLRAGYMRQVAAGIYTYLPLGLRVLDKISQIVKDEMDAIGGQQLLMPAMQPAELWQESGRLNVYGPELVRLSDRHNREFILGPTHEEIITTLVRNELNSYKKLPLMLYQIQTKFRDERRPRSGLLRGREFLMKDAYSFHLSWEDLDVQYKKVSEAYHTIFNKCGVNFRAVEADTGAMGGQGETHEFMALTEVGEDTIVTCTSCNYTANLEKAEYSFTTYDDSKSITQSEKYKQLSDNPIAALIEAQRDSLVQIHWFKTDAHYVAVITNAQHEVNDTKVKNHLDVIDLETIEQEAINALLKPMLENNELITTPITVLIDRGVASIGESKDISDFRNVAAGDCCPKCNGSLSFSQGIELAHIFKLGTKYSSILGAKLLNSESIEQPLIMGCYGIGVSRLLQAVVEQCHDEHGIKWPIALAPYHVHIIPISVKDNEQLSVSLNLYEQLRKLGIEVLLDNRDERAGVKFKDSELIGIPIRITVGNKVNEGMVELKERSKTDVTLVKIDETIDLIKKLLV